MAKINDSDSSLYVSIDAATPDGVDFSRFSSSGADVLFTLAIPNRLLHNWYRHPKSGSYTDLVNSRIRGKVCRLKSTSRLSECLRVQASTVASKASRAGGRKQKFLDSIYHLYVLDNECEDVEALKKDMEHFKLTAARQKDELTAVLEEMAQ